jgi:hypothetical protein
MRTGNYWLVAGLLLVASAETAQAAATKLYLVNPTDLNVVFSVERPGGVVNFTLLPHSSVTAQLADTKDDRVLFASKAGTSGAIFASPYKVYDTSHFNASDSPFDSVGVTLVEDGAGRYRIMYLLQGLDGDVKAASSDETARKLIEKHKEAIKKALEKPREGADKP